MDKIRENVREEQLLLSTFPAPSLIQSSRLTTIPESRTGISVGQENQAADVGPQGGQGSYHGHDERCSIAHWPDDAQPDQHEDVEHNQHDHLHRTTIDQSPYILVNFSKLFAQRQVHGSYADARRLGLGTELKDWSHGQWTDLGVGIWLGE